MLEYRDNHEKLKSIKIYPAEEITLNTKGHVLAYGIHETIKPGIEYRFNFRRNKKTKCYFLCSTPILQFLMEYREMQLDVI